jgi:hypothetical protein
MRLFACVIVRSNHIYNNLIIILLFATEVFFMKIKCVYKFRTPDLAQISLSH